MSKMLPNLSLMLRRGVVHPLKVLSSKEETFPAVPEPVNKASPPLKQCHLTDFPVHSSCQSGQIAVLTTAQLALQQWEKKKITWG